MSHLIQSMDLTAIQWLLVIIAAFFVGFSKTGISGMVMLVIPILAVVFGGKESTGVMLPLLISGDIFAVLYYNRHTQWINIRRLLPWVLIGLVLGLVVGEYINDAQFKELIAVIVIICLVILVYTERKGEKSIPESTWLSILTGVAVGFASMIGNAAGPIFSVYLLAKGYKKNGFMGTNAWFFFIINVTKVPLQIFVWHNITVKSFLTAGLLLPATAIGAVLGAFIIKKLNEKVFRYLIIILTAAASIRLLF